MKQRFAYEGTITTDGSGDATIYLGSKINGRVIAIKYEPGSIVTGGDLTITGETSEVAILAKTDAGTSDVWYYPRVLVNKNSDASAATDALTDIFVFSERVKVVVAQGGDTKTGTITLYTEEDQ
jgi:hypothetical protein